MASFCADADADACPNCGRHCTIDLVAPQMPLHIFMFGSDAEIDEWKQQNRDNVFACWACNWTDQEGGC